MSDMKTIRNVTNLVYCVLKEMEKDNGSIDKELADLKDSALHIWVRMNDEINAYEVASDEF
ncbi:MAG: hypothetical protein KBS60_04115 [Phascolarctobacterium sp.]|nr:hypothetical protein [Candidatus Phascolarctobacterium caballi]